MTAVIFCRLLNSRNPLLGAAFGRPIWKNCYAAGFAFIPRSANSEIISRLKAGMSEGWRLLTQFWSCTTSSSIHCPPALRMSS
jgi:hypothetical protein